MRRVTGLGGIFFKAKDPAAQTRWYGEHLGLPVGEDGSASFLWTDPATQEEGRTVWSPFPLDTEYFKETSAPFMVNYCVDDLDGLLEALRSEGVRIDPHREDYDYGRFAWIWDPEGNRIELWEPPKTDAKSKRT
jgi:predicted enzyme related to lactoylglutathione lyase